MLRVQQLASYSPRPDHSPLTTQNAASDNSLSCTVALRIEEDMAAPVYVYYELRGYYQNHRRFVQG